MTIENRTVARLRIREEPAGSYELDMTSAGTSFTSFLDVPFIKGSLSVAPQQEMLATTYAQQFLDGYSKEILGRKTWQLSYQMHLAPTGVYSDSALSSVESALSLCQKIIMGGEDLSLGTAIASGASTTGCNVTAGQGSRTTPGDGIGLLVQTSPVTYEMVEVKTRATDAITWKVAVATTPAGAILRATTVYLKEDPDTSAQFALDFVETDDRWVLMGGQGSFTVDIPLGGIPTVTFTWKGTDWIQYAGSAIANATFTNISPVGVVSSQFQVLTVASTTRNVLPIQSLTIQPNITYEDVRYPGRQTVYRKRRLTSAPLVTGSFTIPYQDNTFLTSRTNQTSHAIMAQIGNTASKSCLISVPTIQITDVQPTDVNGISSLVVSWKARHDEEIGSNATEKTRSALRFHYA